MSCVTQLLIFTHMLDHCNVLPCGMCCGLPIHLSSHEVSPIEEVISDHSTAELVSGWGLSLPMRMPVVHGDRLDRTAVEDSVTRDDY